VTSRLPITAAFVAAVVAATGCSDDVVLGDLDRGIPLTSGSYELSYGARMPIDCVGAFDGREGEFDEVDAPTAGLVGGTVALTVEDDGIVAIGIEGPAIASTFQSSELVLDGADADDDARVPAQVLATVPIDRAGVDGSDALLGSLGLWVVGASRRHIEGYATICFGADAAAIEDHACRISFLLTLDASAQAEVP
jgi:hypothetical protein